MAHQPPIKIRCIKTISCRIIVHLCGDLGSIKLLLVSQKLCVPKEG